MLAGAMPLEVFIEGWNFDRRGKDPQGEPFGKALGQPLRDGRDIGVPIRNSGDSVKLGNASAVGTTRPASRRNRS